MGKWGFIVRETAEITDNSIEAISVGQLVDSYNLEKIDILKIDIEGSEKELFEQNTGEWLPKTNSVVIELHDTMRPGSSMSFFRALSDYAYALSIKGENIYCSIDQK